MKKRIILFLLTSAFTTSLLFGQGGGKTFTPPTPAQAAANQVARLTKLLGLNSTQVTAATAIFTTSITANQGLQSNLQAARTQVQTDMQKTSPCASTPPACTITPPSPGSTLLPNSTIETDVKNIIAIETTMAMTSAWAQEQFYGILSSEQQTTYNTSRTPGPGGWGGGPGRGPMGPGPQGFRGGPR